MIAEVVVRVMMFGGAYTNVAAVEHVHVGARHAYGFAIFASTFSGMLEAIGGDFVVEGRLDLWVIGDNICKPFTQLFVRQVTQQQVTTLAILVRHWNGEAAEREVTLAKVA